MNPEEVASLGRVVAQESDRDSDSTDSIYLTGNEEEVVSRLVILYSN